ncbi:MAG: DUF1588 domain-containing protein [Oligoflexus sp.]
MRLWLPTLAFFTWTSCSKAPDKPSSNEEIDKFRNVTEPGSNEADFAAFQQSFYPLVQKNCSACHGAFVNPKFADPDPEKAWLVAKEFKSSMPDYKGSPLVDLNHPESSRIYLRLKRDRHSCWGNCDDNAEEMLTAIKQWNLLKHGGGQDVDCQTEDQQVSSRKIRLLSNAEYLNTINDLFGASAADQVNLPNDISKRNLFDHLGDERPVQLSQLKAYYESAHQVSENIITSGRVSCEDQSQCADNWLNEYAWKLWRRPLTDGEHQALKSLFTQALENGNDKKNALQDLITAALVSPNFLYRFELGEHVGGDIYRLNSWEVAAALSYFFWRTLPDDELFNLAKENQLQDQSTIRDQVDRLVEDTRSERGLGDFARLWTRSYRVIEAEKAGSLASRLPLAMRQRLAQETVDFFLKVFHDEVDGDYQSLINAPYSVGDQTLASYYGANLDSDGRLDFGDEPRRGILTQGSLMASYAFPEESSPIHRGVFVLENLLCRHFPEPPAVTIPEKSDDKSNRDRFKNHSKLKECAVCHTQIDGVGFGFEHFDSLGLYRLQDAGKPVDAKGSVILDGLNREYNGTAEFASLLAESRDGKQCFTRQALRYQTGRVESSAIDSCRVERLNAVFAASNYNLKSFMTQLFADPAFLHRRAQREEL